MIKKTIIAAAVFCILISTLGAATTIPVLSEISKPEQRMVIDNDNIYIVEGTTIFIYALKDFKLVAKFGKKGEGPREFMTSALMGPLGQLYLDVGPTEIMVKSLGKLSWFTKTGTFITEKKTPDALLLAAQMMGEKHLVMQKYTIGNVRQIALTIMDRDMNVIKELARVDDSFQMGKGIEVLKVNPLQTIYQNQLFMAWENDMIINVLDMDLKLLHTVKHPLERVKVAEKDKQLIIDFFKTDPSTKAFFDFLKPIRFPDKYPAMSQLFVTGGKIYAMIFSEGISEEREQGFEMLIFDTTGKFLKKHRITMIMSTPIIPYPFSIHEGNLYQIVENEDSEEWEVHITKID